MKNCVQTVHKQLLCPPAAHKLDFSSTLKPFLHNFFALFAPWPNFLPFFSLFPHFVMGRRGQFSPPKSLPWPKTSISPGGGKEENFFNFLKLILNSLLLIIFIFFFFRWRVVFRDRFRLLRLRRPHHSRQDPHGAVRPKTAQRWVDFAYITLYFYTLEKLV